MKAEVILLTGEGASGKSKTAEERILCAYKEAGSPPGRLFYIATMESGTDEAKGRIRRHRRMRSGKGFMTLECPTGLAALVACRQSELQDGFVLLECTGNLVANEMFQNKAKDAADRVMDGIEALASICRLLIVVHNETGRDGRTYHPDVESYRRELGSVGIRTARLCRQTAEIVLSCPLPLHKAKTFGFVRGDGLVEAVITGGRYAGKTAFAREILPDVMWEDGRTIGLDQLGGAEGIDHMEDLIERWLSRCGLSDDVADASACEVLAGHLYTELMQERKTPLSVVCAQMGGGIVPISARERRLQEVTGRLSMRLMEQAENGWLVVCGQSVRLKEKKGEGDAYRTGKNTSRRHRKAEF